MKLEELMLENFRGFEALTLAFHPEVTVIAGINGSGKTSILDAIIQMLQAVKGVGGFASFSNLDKRIGASDGFVVLTGKTESQNVFSARKNHFESGPGSHQTVPVTFTDGQLENGPLPILTYYRVDRHATDSTPGSKDPQQWPPKEAWAPPVGTSSFTAMFNWFREREDLENEERRDSPEFVDHQLQAVRDALTSILPGYEMPRVRRQGRRGGVAVARPTLTVVKGGEELAFDQLSEGERTTAALACDIARRLAIANPHGAPLAGNGVVLIDEIELHLHPKWQAQIIPVLRQTFPNLQLVVTTHSPIVLSYVPSACVRLIKDFKLVEALPNTHGRDPNAMLTDIFEAPIRPREVDEKLDKLAKLIDDERLDEAARMLASLRQELGADDRDLVRLGTLLDFIDT